MCHNCRCRAFKILKKLSYTALYFVLQTRDVQLLQFGGWPDQAKVPTNPGSVLKLLETVLYWQHQTGNTPVIVHCM